MNNDMEAVEAQIEEKRRTVDYDTKDYTIDYIVEKYLNHIEIDENYIYVPEYQREFVWDEESQSKLIESIVLGLPIPVVFFAENDDGRLEIVDGSQRIRTLAAFKSDELTLSGLETIDQLNGLKYSNLLSSRRRKIDNTSIRAIVLSSSATDQIKSDLFERINKGSDVLRNMEKRKGIFRGKFTDFIYNDCSKINILDGLIVLSGSVKNRQEKEELILRFFALSEAYPNYNSIRIGVSDYLDRYIQYKNENSLDSDLISLKEDLEKSLVFIQKTFPWGFSKKKGTPVSRVYFEAIAVGVNLALKEKPDLSVSPIQVSDWLRDKPFYDSVNGKSQTHSPPTIKFRIEYVKNKLLEMAK